MANVSSHASRVWITSARSCAWASAIWAANTVALLRRGASGRSGSRARTPPRPRPSGRRAGSIAEVDRADVAVTSGVVGVDAGGGPHRRRGGRPPRWPPRESATSVPTVISRVDARGRGGRRPAAAVLGEVAGQVAVVVGPAALGPSASTTGSGLRRDAGEQRIALLDRRARRGSRPRPRPRAGAARRACRRRPMRRQISSAVVGHAPGWPGSARCAAPRGRRPARRRPRGRARPSTARWPRGRRWSRG